MDAGLWLSIARLGLSVGNRFWWVGPKLMPRLAEWLGVAVLEVRGQPNKTMRPQGPDYELVWAEVHNLGRSDLSTVRCEARWKQAGRQYAAQVFQCALAPMAARGRIGFDGPPSEAIDIPSNGIQHLLLCAKYAGDANAYATTLANALSPATPVWANPSCAIAPAQYDVELIFTAKGRVTGVTTLTVINDGAQGAARVELIPKRTT